MRRTASIGLAALLVLAPRAARAADEWTLPKPKSVPTGTPITLKRSIADAAKLPHARIVTRQSHVFEESKQDGAIEFDADAKPGKPDGKGRPQVDLQVELTGLAVGNDDLLLGVEGADRRMSILSALDARGFVVEGTARGGVAEKGKVGEILKPVGSWVLPYLPEKPVRVGETWDLPPAYFLWTINQTKSPQDAAPSEGFVTQVLEAIETHDGAKCARVKTAAALKVSVAKGGSLASVLGEGDTVVRIRAEGKSWVDLDGCLREDAFDVKMRVESVTTHKTVDWTFHREVKGRPAGAAPAAKDWSAHMAGLKFVVGFEKGLDEAWTQGKPAMLFITSQKDHWCPIFAARTWKDKEVLEKVKAYLPVLVDADAEPEVAKKYMALILPSVIWVTAEGHQIFAAVGDAPIELFRTLADTARERTPAEPPASYVASKKAADALHAAIKAGDTKATLRAIREVEDVGRPKALVEEARKTQAAIDRRGADELAKAKALLESGKTPEAKEALEKIRQTYGDHAVGREAKDILRKLADEGK